MRPSPEILTRQRIGRTDREIIVTLGEGHWVVLYDDQPINLINQYFYYDRKKYMRNGFAHPGHADNLARKLNRQFDTDKFTVRKVL